MPNAENTFAESRVLDLSGRVARHMPRSCSRTTGRTWRWSHRGGARYAGRGRSRAAGPTVRGGCLAVPGHLNKRSVTLDIATATGQAMSFEGSGTALIIEDFEPGRMEALGLGYDTLLRIKRRLVLLGITPFGQTGPRAGWKATATMLFRLRRADVADEDGTGEPLVNGTAGGVPRGSTPCSGGGRGERRHL